MVYMILNFDRTDAGDLRARHRIDHLRYVDDFTHQILASGALTEDDDVPFAGFILLDVNERSEAVLFSNMDPLSQAGLFERVIIAKWKRGIFNFERVRQ